MRDLYKVLGVSSKADEARVKSAFRDRAKTLHPDVNAGDETAEQRFKELNQAYETLSDPKARAAYELGVADERLRARRNMRSVTITMFVISMFSTAGIFGGLIWLLSVAQRTALADRAGAKHVAGSLQEANDEQPQALASRPRADEPKKAQVPAVAASKAAAPTKESQPPSSLPGQKIAAPLPAALPALLSPCDAHFVEQQPGLLGLTLVDESRAGSSIVIKVDDLHHRANFAADGRLELLVPNLSAASVFQWALADGTPCRQTSAAALFPRLSIALVWAGYAGLDMHVIEPNAWLGSPIGHVSSSRPNLDGKHGAGTFRTFGQPGDSTRVQLFVVDPSKLGDRRFLNAVVTLDRAKVGECAQAGQASEVRYQVYIYQSGRRSDVSNPEVRSMAFQLPKCGEPGGERVRSENILVRF